MSFAAIQIDTEIIIASEISQKEKDKYQMISLICGNLKKLRQMNIHTKQKQTYRHRKKLTVTEGRAGG